MRPFEGARVQELAALCVACLTRDVYLGAAQNAGYRMLLWLRCVETNSARSRFSDNSVA